MTLELKVCNDKEKWNRFVAASPQANIFCCSPFLDASEDDYDLLFVEKQGAPQLGAVVLKNGRQGLWPHVYQGVLFDSSVSDLPDYKRSKLQLDIMDYFLKELERMYDSVTFRLHHNFMDLRSFQWFHRDKPDKGHFDIRLQYTALLDLKAFTDFDAYLAGIRKVRRYEYKHAQSIGLKLEESNDIETLDRLHEITFKRQGIERPDRIRHYVQVVSKEALATGFGRLLLCRNSKGTVVSTSVFLYDTRSGHYILGANDPEYRKTGGGTYVLLENIRWCKERGLSSIDFGGINLENIGDFKTSFNARPAPYFIAKWERPS